MVTNMQMIWLEFEYPNKIQLWPLALERQELERKPGDAPESLYVPRAPVSSIDSTTTKLQYYHPGFIAPCSS